MTWVFKCQECGHCCGRIVIEQHGVRQGLCLRPGEETLFASFPGSVVPYIGIRRPGRARVKTVSYQMIREPCPLYDPITKRCTTYKHRPVACRSYPFSFLAGGGQSLEVTCSWAKAQKDVVFGKTEIKAGAEQNLAAAKIAEFFIDLRSRMERTGYIQLMIYDVALGTWDELSRE